MSHCRACGEAQSEARIALGYDHCPGCAALCRARRGCSKPGAEIAVVGVAKSIPMYLPATTVTGETVRSGTRRA